MSIKAYLLLLLLTLIPCLANAEIIDVNIKGVDDGVKTTKQQDYKEAVLFAKREAIERAGVKVKALTTARDFVVHSDYIESEAEAVLLPGYNVVDVGYQTDGTYLIILIGKVKHSTSASEEKKKDFSGMWTGRASGTSLGDTFTDTFRVESSGNLIRIFMVNSRYSFLYEYSRPGDMLFQLTLSGTRLDGKHMMKREMGDGGCVAITQPPVTGELRDDGKLMILVFDLKFYQGWRLGSGCYGMRSSTYQLVLSR